MGILLYPYLQQAVTSLSYSILLNVSQYLKNTKNTKIGGGFGGGFSGEGGSIKLRLESVLYRTVLNKTVLLKTVLNNKTKFSSLNIIYITKSSLRRSHEVEA